MSRRTITFLVFAAVLAALCVRLGFWQLSRLDQRRARNADVEAQLRRPAVPLAVALHDSAVARFRAVEITGRYDYTRELVVTSRSRNGAPGVHLVTPLYGDGVPGGEAILVNRGWVYAADGMTVDRERWQEGDTATIAGYLETFTEAVGPVSTPSVAHGVRRLVRDSVEQRLGEPVAPFVVVQRLGYVEAGTGGGATTVEHPWRLDEPRLDEGAHLGYAWQWFAFATIAVVGGSVVAARGRRD